MVGPATIVGAQGFVGRRLHERLLAEGRRVWAPERGEPGLLSRSLGTVFYCAGLTADYDARPFDTVEAHASLVSAIVRAGRFDRLIYLSSTRLYDGQTKAEVGEDEPLVFDPADPRRVYDLSKALGENLTLARTGGRGAVARLANVYDWEDGAPGFLSEWLIRARTGRSITLQSSPHVRRDYIHLDDVVAALVAMAEGEPAGIVNLASGELVSNGEIAGVFRDAGWEVAFTGDAAPSPPPNARIGKLRALGVAPAR
ncbi:NAD(P)-dependent oxidoreductase [Phenylobacterium sp. J367]|uniref:NAD-dependent epimerase/dehydratase family protein n=1 Tax=Phenylobacterium sp. J367 TaxID=2898435 RepID=UPI00215140BB|nr:NAD-dependent epimerase/dehydratase family protein [Phenylobacterium sp. J367]MCR5877523.1 NAD-dependent epimerase/dehydratase family protein [Phenylobacterium sp. J367]